MSQGSYYEINVALNGKHHFATAPRSLSFEQQAKDMVVDMRKRFPESEGYSVTCTHYKSAGHKTNF